MTHKETKVALVTGANRGIGYEIAHLLAAKGIIVIIGTRDPQRGLAAQKRLRSQGLEVHAVRVDVTDPASIQAAVTRIMDTHRRLDILVNNAGISMDSRTGILQLNPTLLQNTLATNAFGPLLLSQACIPRMQANHHGRIVNMASTLGSLTEMASPDSAYGQVKSPAYRLSKTLLNAMTILLANELRGSNILVNSACPGWVRTKMGGDQAPLSPQEGADTPVWLATLPDDGPTGGFFRQRRLIPW